MSSSSNSAPSVLSKELLLNYIEATSESSNIDAKQSIVWDGRESSASLSKDFAAFANSAGGGVIVIGKPELDDGSFDLSQGCSDADRKSFETTKVAQWVNQRFSPPITLEVHHVERDAVWFVVIVVEEFDDIPVVCVKGYRKEGTKHHLLKKGSTYIRNSNAESAPVMSADESRTLYGLATKKKNKELSVEVAALLKAASQDSEKKTVGGFEADLVELKSRLPRSKEIKELATTGTWTLCFHPTAYRERRFSVRDDLLDIVSRNSVGGRFKFPEVRRSDTYHSDCFISDTFVPKLGSWMFTETGMFWFQMPFMFDPRNRTSLDYDDCNYILAHMLEFSAKLASEFEGGEELSVSLEVDQLKGRTLRMPELPIRGFRASHQGTFSFRRRFLREDLMAERVEIASKLLVSFQTLFRVEPPTDAAVQPFIRQ